MAEHVTSPSDQPAAPPTPEPTYPIPLSTAMIEAIRTWAVDTRLWGSQSAAEINLCTFARVILKAHLADHPVEAQASQGATLQKEVEALKAQLKAAREDYRALAKESGRG